MLPEDIKDKTVLIAPLDWGMGHLTRCLPIVRTLEKNNNRVVFAGTAFQCNWMSREVSGLITELIRGFDIKLDTSKSTYFQMLSQSAKMRSVFKQENLDAENLVSKYGADIVLSDNRYGFKSDEAYSVLLTHQLSPPIPKLRNLITKKIISWVNQFDECWIVDDQSMPICDVLNSPALNIPKTYIGWQSRFSQDNQEQLYNFLFIASGPEPQLSKFTKKITQVLKKNGFAYKLIVPEDMGLENQEINPTSEQLNLLISKSKMVICRAGYTSLMEMLSISKKCLLIPTPGQFEQEFISRNVTADCVSFTVESRLEQYFTSFTD